ncbi:MAG: CHASE2 domain-containing protein [Prochlorococcaceae cyanobacterium]
MIALGKSELGKSALGKTVKRRWLQPLSRPLRDGLKSAAPYGIAALGLLGLKATPVPETLNLLFYDVLTAARRAPSAADEPVAIITLAESDIKAYGWPIDDGLLCRAIDRLLASGVTAVGLDLYRDKGVGPNQACLQERFRREPKLVSIFNAAEGIPAVPGTPASRQSYNDLVVDPDGVMRRDLVHVAGQDEATVTLPMRLLEVATGSAELRGGIERNGAGGPWLEPNSGGYAQLDAAGYQEMLRFRELGSMPSWTLEQLLATPGIPAEKLKGRIVLIGSSAPSLRDLFPVPHTRMSAGISQLLVPGVEIHAHRLLALHDRRRGDQRLQIQTIPGWSRQALILTCAVLGIALGEGFGTLRRSVLMGVVAMVLLVAGSGALQWQHIWVGLSMPLASLSLMAGSGWVRRGAASQQQRQQIEKLLGQTTSPAVAKQLWNERDTLLADGRFEGRQLPVTVLMTDICGFTSVSERLSPEVLLAWLNRGMASFVPAVTERGGMVNKFTGDGLLAVFGAPLSLGPEIDAIAAIETALKIQEEIVRLNRELEAEGAPTIRMRIGIHSGEVVAGSLGSSERLEYAVIGDTVNCASRLESLEKSRQDNICRVLVSSSTRDLLSSSDPLSWQRWGEMQVKGRQEPLQIWELRGRLSSDRLSSASLSSDSAPEPAPASPG